MKGTVANAYCLPAFYIQLKRLAKEFPLWSGVMTPFFNSYKIRATSAPSEGHFNELKNSILNGAGLLGVHKLFILYWRAMQGATLIGASKLISTKMIHLSNVNKNAVSKRALENTKTLLNQEKSRSISDKRQDDHDYFNIIKKKVESESEDCEDSELYAVDNWRNKAKRDDLILNLLLTDSPEKKRRKICTDPEGSVEKDDKKNVKSLENEIPAVNNRKQTKFFRPYPEIKHIEVTSYNKNKKVNLFLKNGNFFKNVIRVNKRPVIVKNTCPFDSLIIIIAIAATDNEAYFNYIQKNSTLSKAFGFVLTFLETGGLGSKVGDVYVERASILMDIFMTDSKHQSNDQLYQSNSPRQLRVIDAYSGILLMWKHLMEGESISFSRIQTCQDGHVIQHDVENINVHETIIQTKGFNALQESLLLYSNFDQCSNEDCTCEIAGEIICFNRQLFVELDIRLPNNKSLTCLPTDLPAYLEFETERFR